MTVDEARRRVLERRSRRPSAASTARSRSWPPRACTVRLARSLDRPMRYFLAKRHEGPALLRRRSHRHAARGARRPTGWRGQFHPSYTRMVPAHYVVEIALVGCPDPDPIYTRFFTPARGDAARRPRRDRPPLHRRAARRDRRSGCGTSSASRRREPIGVAFSGGIDSGVGVPRDLPHDAAARPVAGAAQGVRARTSATDPTSSRRARSCRRSGSSLFLEEIDATPDGLDVDETLRVLEDYKPLDVECAAMGLRAVPRHPRALPGVAASRRRRRRRREPQGLSDRGEPRAHDPQRRRQPDAVPGRLGRRPHQALADLQRRPQPQLRADLRAGAALRLRRLQPATRARRRSRSPKASRSRR